MVHRTLDGWISKSFQLPWASKNPLLTYNFQSIGKLDSLLSDEWIKMKDHFTEQGNILKFDHHTFQCSLWVMAAYECMRILKKIDSRPETKAAYELFRRVRIPLVKFEIPRGHEGDFGIAYPVIGQDMKDLGWIINSQMFVSRNELADVLYVLYG